jgi:hypothetical protein
MPPRRAPEEQMQQMMEAQAQLMKVMTQFLANAQNNNNNNNNPPPPPPPQVDMLARFLRLCPTKFSHGAEPLEAMDWLHSVNKDLVTTGCTDAEKVRFAAHLLEGPAASWWDTYQITHPIEGVTWDSFQEGFRAAHISSGVMGLKKKEFRDLRQKYRSVSEYIDEFTSLSRYVPDDIDTNAKRKKKFLEGLNDELSIPLSVAYTPTFQSLLDQAITLESKIKQSENRKRKHHVSKYQEPVHKRSFHSGSGSSGFHKNGLNHHNNNGGNGHQYHKGNGHHHNGHMSHNNHNSTRTNGHNNGNNNGRNNNVPEKRDISQVECFKCHKTGHYANDCPQKKDEGNKPNPFQKGHVNHVNVEEIYDEPDAIYGTF